MKLLGTLFGAGVAVGAGSLLFFPFLIIIIVMVLSEGISTYWPWLVGALLYSVLIWIVLAIVPGFPARLFTGIALAAAPPIAALVTQGVTWASSSLAGLSLCVFAGTSALALARHSTAKLTRLRGSLDSKTRFEIERIGYIGLFFSVQPIWLAPAYLMFSSEANLLLILVTLVGMLVAIFAMMGLAES